MAERPPVLAGSVESPLLPVWLAVAVAGALLGLQLIVPPVIGLANNGDFESVMVPVGIQSAELPRAEKYFGWIVTRFAYATPESVRTDLLTSETLLAGVARGINRTIAPGSRFDLRVLGSLHALLLILGIGLIVSAAAAMGRVPQWITAALLVFVFTDVGYVAPLNSFFSQAASLVFLLLTLGVAARAIGEFPARPATLAAYFVLAALFVCSKPQESIQAPLLAAFGIRLSGHRVRDSWRRPAGWAALALCILSFWYYRQTPPAIAEVARYHKVFMELLVNSPSPESDLVDLGLDPAWRGYVGQIAYKPESAFNDPTFRRAFLARFTYPRLARFYLTHPGRLLSVLDRGGSAALQLRHPRFGNFEKSAGLPAGAQTRAFSSWSRMRRSLPGHPLLWLSLLFGGTLVAIVRTYRQATGAGRRAREGLLLLISMAVVAFTVCVFANAHGDLPRHFYVFHALTDLILIADVAWIVHRGMQRWGGRSAAPFARAS